MNRTFTLLVLLATACKDKGEPVDTGVPTVDGHPHGPIAANISAPLGEVVPFATSEQRATFARGRDVALERHDFADGLGPAFNVTFCASCHEKPVTGGAAGLYRNFFLTGIVDEYGSFFPAESAGTSGGVVRLYSRPGFGEPEHPTLDDRTNIVAQRSPIPFFGVGLIAELDEAALMVHADPTDADGDGISGRPNYDRGFVGRFGRKSQTVSIEGFIRGPLKNHLGITTDPLTEAQKAALPVDSSSGGDLGRHTRDLTRLLLPYGQAAASDGPITDLDEAPDPELSTDDLFDLVSFAMLMAAPEIRIDLNEDELRGVELFDELQCAVCHVPRVAGPRGPLPLYSDLMLHDMGPELADGLEQGEAEGDEFRTQPLWGVAAVAPYLHDGRAFTLDEAIRLHGGEAAASAAGYAALSAADQARVIAFLHSLGGEEQATGGLLLPDQPVPAPGEYGGPSRALDDDEMSAFVQGRAAFDFEYGLSDGVGAPRFNGDSCRACHFEPTIGGAGPRGVNVIRHGILNGSGEFVPPSVGTILHRLTALQDSLNPPQSQVNTFELRNTPPLFGLGLIDALPESVILANEDPEDADGDGISGRASWVDGDRLGRFGWKGQVPSIEEFVRDAVSVEMGMTLPYEEGLTFGILHDNDDVPDPEATQAHLDQLRTFLSLLGPPPRTAAATSAAASRGESSFSALGCASCHVPALEGPDGPVPLFSDLLLHAMAELGEPGIEEAGADTHEYRTPPLWGLSTSAPYLHDGSADTLDEAIAGHGGEGQESADAYSALDAAAQADLRAFLESL